MVVSSRVSGRQSLMQKPINKWSMRRDTNAENVQSSADAPVALYDISNLVSAAPIREQQLQQYRAKRSNSVTDTINAQSNKRNKAQPSTIVSSTANRHQKSKSISALTATLSQENSVALGRVNQLSEQLEQAVEKNSVLQEQVHQLTDNNNELTVKLQHAECSLTEHEARCHQLAQALQACQQELIDTSALSEQQTQQIEQHNNAVQSLQHTIDQLKQQAVLDAELRKKLHNQLQTLKGCIRVYVRCRKTDGASMYDIAANSDCRVLNVLQNGERVHSFSFDRIFDGAASQSDIFGDVSELIASVLDGDSVNLLAYGATGSGKTYTVSGASSECVSELRGLIPRSVEQIFSEIARLQQLAWQYTAEVTYLELYNDNISDLTVSNDKAKHEIKLQKSDDGTMHTYVTNLNTVQVNCAEDIYQLLNTANRNRSVASTSKNDQSSRSHTVFSLKLTGVHDGTKQCVAGRLTLVDLAGSERLSVHGASASAERVKETQRINSSLSALGDCIAAISMQHKHVPYRNSKLPHLLEPYLVAQHSKTLMLIHVNDNESSFADSVQSLRFGEKVSSCVISSKAGQKTATQRKGSVHKL